MSLLLALLIGILSGGAGMPIHAGGGQPAPMDTVGGMSGG